MRFPLRLVPFLLFCLLTTLPASAQKPAGDVLARYAACKLPGGPVVVETANLPATERSRTVKTRKGDKTITLERGRRIMFAYPNEDFYANVKAERLPEKTYADEKQSLIDGFDFTLSVGQTTRNYGMKPVLNGYEIQGMDRNELSGGVLGIYVLFDDARHDVLTIYFLNQNP